MAAFAAAILLCGTVSAHAQDGTDAGVASGKGRSARASGSTGSSADSTEFFVEADRRLPNVFRNCWHPLPWFCARPTGSLWFGSLATLQHHGRAARRASMGHYY